jgi:hypothetical protein
MLWMKSYYCYTSVYASWTVLKPEVVSLSECLYLYTNAQGVLFQKAGIINCTLLTAVSCVAE